MAGEFNLITTYFVNRQTQRKDVQLSLGDDSALVTSPKTFRSQSAPIPS